LSLPKGSGYDDWKTISENINLNVGENKIELKANSTLPCSLYIDNFKVEGDFGDAVSTVEPLNGKFIKNLIVNDKENSADWSINEKFENGALLFGDRDVTAIDIPANLIGAEFVKTACDSKMFAEDLGKFTAGDDVTIYIAVDNRVVPIIPEWLKNWTKTDDVLTATGNLTFTIYKNNFKSGEEVTLGTNGGTGDNANYVVFAKNMEIVLNGKLIKNLQVFDSENAADWSINEKFENGALLFGDRDVTAIDIPANLIGAEFVKTACDSKMFASNLGTFTAGADITVYIAVDSRVVPVLPDWLGDWEKADGTISATSDLTFELYRKNFNAGETVTLGMNGGNGNNTNYLVFAKNKEIILNGELIKNLQVYDTENGSDWSIYNNTGSGSVLYGDRQLTATSFPENLVGAETIRTACDSKLVTSDLGKFTAGEDITVYVALDSRVSSTLPSWLNDWKQEEITISTSNDLTLILFKKNMKAGEELTLGTNGGSNESVNYIVIASKQENEVPGDADLDGKVGISDVVKVMMYVANKDANPLSEQGIINADVYNKGDGVFISDALSIQKKVAQIIDILPEN
ncbi:MAG: hypothetical protein MR434_05080, partial [Ruminococcus sp.]|nr:hypothetical protein [Ruminococcus sp.]